MINTLFHPSYLNNFHEVFVNKNLCLEDVIEKNKKDLNCLNEIIHNSFIYATEQLVYIKAAVSKAEFEEALKVIEIWANHIKAKNYFLTVECFDYFVRMFFLLDLCHKNFDQILLPLINIPMALKGFIRVNYLKPDLMNSFLTIQTNIDIIESVEILRDDIFIPNREKMPGSRINFAHNKVSVIDEKFIALFKIREDKNHIHNGESCHKAHKYSMKIGEHCVISQGFSKYKQMLESVNLLDSIYDASSNFALTINN